MGANSWPALPYAEWKETYATLHMWTQVVGKIALAQAPPLNHSWGIAFQVTPRGLATRLLHTDTSSFGIEFDFIAHQLAIRVANGESRELPLVPMTVAAFYASVQHLMHDLQLPMKVWSVPSEVPTPIRFEQDTVHAAYDSDAANRLWRILWQAQRVMSGTCRRFVGKCSPVHFFWGGFDLALTRFSGRQAPPREGPAFMREAYSHEVISHGFWPGNDALPEPVFYGYAVPEPAGLREARVDPPGVYYHRELGEFILPYDAVRRAADPDAALRQFIDSTYQQAATLGGWDRGALERSPD